MSTEPKSAPGENPWTVTASARVLSNAWFEVEANDVIRPDGSRGSYDLVRMRKVGVAILPLHDDGTADLIGQWRLPIGRFSWELPMGSAEAGEAVEVAARRELSEETGLSAGHWTPLFEIDLSTSLTDERCQAFLATDLHAGRPHPESREELRRRRVPLAKLVDEVTTGVVREAMSVATILKVSHMAVSGELASHLSLTRK